jgi:riboflavin synthase
MFSGIVEELGQVKRISHRGKVVELNILAKKVLEDIRIGDSIAIDGACLTVVGKEKDILSFELMPETLKTTTLGSLKSNDKVNLERSLKIGDRLSGHFVNGHIDCLGIIRNVSYLKDNLCFEIAIPAEFLKHCLGKGSIAIDGISLTIQEKRFNCIKVYIIPHTFQNTCLKFKHPADKVNIEFDILTKQSHQ